MPSFRSNSILVLTLVAAVCGGVISAQEQPAWWDARWRFRSLLEFDDGPRPNPPAGSVWIHMRADADHGGKDIRVVGPAGNVLPFSVIHGTSDGRYLVAFETAREAGYHAVYYDNPNADAAPQQVPARGLIYYTLPMPRNRNPDSWEKAWKAIQEAGKPYGADFWPQVFDAYNPWGPQHEYVALYRGYLNCSRAGTYRFAVLSQGPAFLLIDDAVVAKWLGYHNIWAGRQGEHSGSVELRQGTHKLTFAHFVRHGNRRGGVAWVTPGERRFRVIPEAAFPAIAEATPVECQQYGHYICADFSYEPLRYCEAGKARMVAVRFTSHSGVAAEQLIRRYEWDFGDGQTSTEARPKHTYLATETYNVTLRITSSSGRRAVCTKRVAPEPIWDDLDFRAPKLNAFYESIRGYNFDRLPTPSLLGAWHLFRETEREQEAVAAAERLEKRRDDLNPADFHEVAMFLGRHHRDRTGRYDAAERYFKLAREGVPEGDRERRLDARFALADLYLNHAFRPEQARDECVKLQADFADGDARDLRRATIMIGDSYRNETHAQFRRTQPDRALILSREERAPQEQLDKALEHYRQAEGNAKFVPEQPEALVKGVAYQQIEAYLRSGEHEAALEQLDELLWHYPTLRLEGRPFHLRVRALLLKGDAEQARRRADIYLSFGRDPNFVPVLLADAGEACADLGLIEQARQYYDEVLDGFAESPQAQEAEDALRRLGF